MKQILKKLVVYIIILAVLFYLIPISTKGGAPIELMVTLLIVLNPIACLGTSTVFGIKHGFKWYFLIIVPLLFIPSIYVFYNSSAFIYVIMYMFFSATGLGIGCVLRKFSKR